MATELGEVRMIDGHPCYITGGQYLSDSGRVSNHFHWRKIKKDGFLTKKEYFGYGGIWPVVEDAEIEIRVRLPKKLPECEDEEE